MKTRLYLCNCLLVASIFLAVEPRAHAYADAGTGLLVLQSLGAFVSGCLFFVRKQIKAGLFKKKLERQ